MKSEQSHSGAVTTGTPAVTYGYEDGADVDGNALYHRLKKMTYPSGREIYYIYEAPPVGRLLSQSENAGGTQNLVEYTYLGMSTIVKETHPQVSRGLTLSYGSSGTYAGWDRFGRIAEQLWKNDAGTTVDGYTYTYDRAGNRTSKNNSLNSTYSETYSYDGLNRLVDANRNSFNLQDWGLDALGNWGNTTAGTTSQTRTNNSANEITDISGTGGWVDPAYDAAGNMTTIPQSGNEAVGLIAAYDAWNHLVSLTNPATNHMTMYGYDGLGRRVTATDATRLGVGPILVVNDGSIQRSMVVSVTVVFETPVTLQAGAIALVQRGGSAVPFTLANPSGDGRTWTLTFTGGNLEGGSLPDGVYDVTVDGTKVLVNGNALGQNYSYAFHRLLGDLNGSRAVNVNDRNIEGAFVGLGRYIWFADMNGDAVMDTADRDIVNSNSGHTVSSYDTGAVFTNPSTTAALPPVSSGSLTWGFDRVHAGDCTRDFYYNEQYQVVEERADDADTLIEYVTANYVYDQRYIDAPVMVYRDTNADGVVDQKLYVAQDANFDVTATVNGDTGSVANRFVYTPYGARTVMTVGWTAGSTDFTLGHQGLRLDAESGMYYNRARFYHPTLGVFTERDPNPAGQYNDGMSLYQYVGGGPTVNADPSGMQQFGFGGGPLDPNPGFPPGWPRDVNGIPDPTFWALPGPPPSQISIFPLPLMNPPETPIPMPVGFEFPGQACPMNKREPMWKLEGYRDCWQCAQAHYTNNPLSPANQWPWQSAFGGVIGLWATRFSAAMAIWEANLALYALKYCSTMVEV